MTSGKGGGPGAGEGGRESSRPASLVILPASARGNGVQGGAGGGETGPGDRGKNGDRGDGREAPSLSRDTAGGESLIVRVPVGLPPLTVPVSRTLLAILVELTTIEMIEVSPHGG
ncbi:hypothetical protein GCM10009608_33500 [Pseudonocardia alaniniphila]